MGYIKGPTGEFDFYPGKNISWSLIPQFPDCQTVDLARYFNLSRMTPKIVFFYFQKHPNLGITVQIGDKRKSLARRRLIQNSFECEGAKIGLESLYSSQTRTYAVTVSQIIDLETDKGKNCMDYPNTNYSSYRECDENFVYNEVEKNYNIMPFWAAKNIDAITHIAYYIQETF